VTGNAWEGKVLFVRCFFVCFVLFCCIFVLFFAFSTAQRSLMTFARPDGPLPPPATVDVVTQKVLAKEMTEWNISSPAARNLLFLLLILVRHMRRKAANLSVIAAGGRLGTLLTGPRGDALAEGCRYILWWEWTC
jgi:hypothetical protein